MIRRSCILLLPAIFGMAGCDRAWQAYEKIELGRPLAKDILPPDAVCCHDGVRLLYLDHWPLPAWLSMSSLALLTDAEGKVIAKSYCRSQGVHWLLALSDARKMVSEIDVPADWFVDTPESWPAKDRFIDAWNLANELAEIHQAEIDGFAPQKDAVAKRAGMLGKLLACLAGQAPQEDPSSPQVRNVAGYCMAAQLAMDYLPCQDTYPGPQAQYLGWNARAFDRAATGAPREGRLENDEHYRVARSGPRRIHIELQFGGFHVFGDPYWLFETAWMIRGMQHPWDASFPRD